MHCLRRGTLQFGCDGDYCLDFFIERFARRCGFVDGCMIQLSGTLSRSLEAEKLVQSIFVDRLVECVVVLHISIVGRNNRDDLLRQTFKFY